MGSQRGATLVETALCFLLFASMLFGVMLGSIWLFSYHFLSEAAREGARYAIVRGSSCTSFTPNVSGCPAANSDIQNYIRGLSYPSINSSSIAVTTKWNGSTTATGNNSAGKTVSVQVQYPFTFSIPLVATQSITMTSTSTMVISE